MSTFAGSLSCPRGGRHLGLWFCWLLLAGGVAAAEFQVRVSDRLLHPIKSQLFGQFLERASWGEPGPEAFADPATGRLPTNIVAALQQMRIPVIRFPGGTDVDRTDWTDMIDNVTGRVGPRPVSRIGTNQVSNRFGYDEYFELRDQLGCETILVLNLVDALAKRRPLQEAVQHSAGLVAYANAAVGAALPAGMVDWPAVRARNGYPQPFRAQYIQLGNEWFVFHQQVSQATGLAGPALAQWYIQVLHAFIRAVRAIDPEVPLILDGNLGDGLEQIVLRDPLVRQSVRYLAFHSYAPGSVGPVRRGGQSVAAAELGLADWWYASVAMPGRFVNGLNQGLGDQIELARALGYRVVCSEWNWNGWGYDEAVAPFKAEYLPMAQAVGVAGFLHGLMRQGAMVDLATQSMLLGQKWGITAVRADPQGRVPPYFLPQGLATMLYARHHGEQLLALEHDPLPARVQPYTVGRWTHRPETSPALLADLDLLASANPRQVFVHAINRHFDLAQPLSIDLKALGISQAQAVHHRLDPAQPRPETPQTLQILSTPAQVQQGRLQVSLPARSINILVIDR